MLSLAEYLGVIIETAADGRDTSGCRTSFSSTSSFDTSSVETADNECSHHRCPPHPEGYTIPPTQSLLSSILPPRDELRGSSVAHAEPGSQAGEGQWKGDVANVPREWSD